jgi:hypothetical protein
MQRAIPSHRSRAQQLLVSGLPFFLFPFSFFLGSPAVWAQEEQPKPVEYALTLCPVGPPAPSFKYELLPARDLVKNNAALLEHRALHLLTDTRPAGREFYEERQRLETARDKPIKEFPKEEVRAFLKPFGNVFKEMEAAAKCDHCDWGTDDRIAAEGIGFLLPDAQKMRDLAFLLTLRCRLHAADGKVDLALRDVQTGFALARHAAQGPTFIHFLIGTAISTLMIHELEEVMQVPECPNLYWSLTALPRPLIDLKKAVDGELRSMDATIPLPKEVEKGPMTPEDALATLDREWAGIQKLADDSDRLGLAQSRLALAAYITMKNPSARKSLLAAGKTEAELDAMPPAQVVMLDALVRFRNLRDQHFAWFNAPYTEAIQGMRQNEARIRELRRNPSFDYFQAALLLLLPAADKVYGAEIRTERRIASLRVVEAVRLYSARNGCHLPARLADVTDVPVPVDPATGQPFEYIVEGNRFTVNVPLSPGERPSPGNAWKYVVTLAK